MFGGAYPRPLTSFILDQQYKQQAIKKGMKEVCNQFQWLRCPGGKRKINKMNVNYILAMEMATDKEM